jgi:hypothetical protein
VRITPEGHERPATAFNALAREREAFVHVADDLMPRLEQGRRRFETPDSG